MAGGKLIRTDQGKLQRDALGRLARCRCCRGECGQGIGECGCNTGGGNPPECDTGIHQLLHRRWTGPFAPTVIINRPIRCCCLQPVYLKHIGLSRSMGPPCGLNVEVLALADGLADNSSGTWRVPVTIRTRTWGGPGCGLLSDVSELSSIIAQNCHPRFSASLDLPTGFRQGEEFRDCGTWLFDMIAADGPSFTNYVQVYQRSTTSYERFPCVVEPCPRGACCCNGLCYSHVSAGECANMRGQYHGDGSSCQEVTCPNNRRIGACCKPDGTCVETSRTHCESTLLGTYMGDNVRCFNVDCPDPPEWACCLPDNTCSPMTLAECLAAGGGWHKGQPCSEELCVPDPSLGACCYLSGDCEDLTFEDCANSFGYWAGPGTTCATTDCSIGRCCGRPGDSICAMMTCPQCFEQGGTCTPGQGCPCIDVLGLGGPQPLMLASPEDVAAFGAGRRSPRAEVHRSRGRIVSPGTPTRGCWSCGGKDKRRRVQ